MFFRLSQLLRYLCTSFSRPFFDFSINFYGKNQDEHAILGTQNTDAKLLHMCLCVCIKYSRLAYGKSAKGKEFTEIKFVNM